MFIIYLLTLINILFLTAAVRCAWAMPRITKRTLDPGKVTTASTRASLKE